MLLDIGWGSFDDDEDEDGYSFRAYSGVSCVCIIPLSSWLAVTAPVARHH